MNTVKEPAREIPVYAECDVLVAGGGLAGVASAVAAARAGAETILLERNGCLGGVACATMMGNIGNRMILSGKDQVVKGVAGEIVERLVEAGAANPNWKQHKAVAMDSERLKVILIDILQEAGVETLTHSMAAMPVVEDNIVKGCFFESKSGRLVISALNTVDCTGEADLACRAGAEVNEHRASSSLLYKLTGVDIDRFVDFAGEDPDAFPDGKDWIKDYDEFASRWRDDGVLFFAHHGGKFWSVLQDLADKAGYGEKLVRRGHNQRWYNLGENIDAFGMYTHTRNNTLYINTGYYCFDKINIKELAAYELDAQKLCYYSADFLIKNIPGFENAKVEHIGTDLGLRGGRYIVGRTEFKRADMFDNTENVYYDDVIGTTPCQPTEQGMGPGSLGTITDVPFGSCVPVNISGLLVGSGKSVYTEGGNYRLYRGMSGCMMYGQATGAAAAVASQQNTTADKLQMIDIQYELHKQNVRLGDDNRLQELGILQKA
ncbi:MAG: FAD-dependent oxidoreductase [Planctomycetota bacterium]